MAGELVVTICIDPHLGISTEVQVRKGSKIRDLAELLAAQDPTGGTAAEEVGFRLSPSTSPVDAVPRVLGGDTVLDERHVVLDLCSPESSEPAPDRELDTGAPRGALYAISDTHCEAKPNMTWLEELPAYPNDTIILAGDVGVEITNLEVTLRSFLSKFKHVFYCFGNHECWVNKRKCSNSFEKLEQIRSLCNALGVRTSAALVDGAWIVPIFGWYHTTWDTEPPLALPPGAEFKRKPRDADKMSSDYIYCQWCNYEHGSEELAQRLDEENEKWGAWPLPEELLAEARLPPGERRHPIVSFSHFLPRVELFFEKRMSMEPNLSKLIGSNFIRARVDQLQPDIHVFGHTHVCWDMTLDGVRYLSWPLGMPEERHWRGQAFPRSETSLPLKVLDSSGSQAAHEDACFGSRMYKLIDRAPTSFVMGHRIANKFCPQAPVLFDDVCMPGRFTAWALPQESELREKIARSAKLMKELKRKDPPIYNQWRVVGGEDRGGILVREGAKLESAKLPERLSTGSVVEEISRIGDRLMYRLMAGSGPEVGWVATALPDKDLLVPEPMPPKPGELGLEQVLRLQEALIKHLSRPEVQRSLRSLLETHQGKRRTLAPFAKQRREILQAEFDKVLPAFGFQKGNMMQLDTVILDFYDFHTGSEKVKRNKRQIEQLMCLYE